MLIVLFECEHIIAVDALIVDGVHQLLHQQDAQATDGTVFGIERGVDLVGLRRVKGFTLVGDDDFEPLLGANQLAKTTSFEKWYGAVVFENAEFRLSREECINEVADKDGGAHLDKLIHANYACFRQPTALQFIIDGEVARFNQNPVYVSLRQIAWEVLESLKEIQ